MYYLCFCITNHGKRYWVISGDWTTIENCVKHEAIEAEYAREAEECASQNFDLSNWVSYGAIIGWDFTVVPDLTYVEEILHPWISFNIVRGIEK